MTSIPSNNILYLSPATPFLIIFVVLGIYLGFRAASALSRVSVIGAQDKRRKPVLF
jgi:xanthosine utilization system XapX-like protein